MAGPSVRTKTAELVWAGRVKLDIESAPDEVVVRFDRPLLDRDIENFSKVVSSELADFRWNDTSLVLRPAEGRRLAVAANGNSLHVKFFSDRASLEAPAAIAAVSQEDPLEFLLVKAQADAAAGYVGQARNQLAKLAERYPNNLQVQRALADAEAGTGAISSAADRYRQLQAVDSFARRTIAESKGGFASEAILRSAKTFSQREGQISFSNVPFSSGRAFGGGVRHIRTRFEQADSSRETRDVEAGSTIVDVTAGLELGAWSRLMVQGSGLLGSKVFGAGGRLTVGPQERQLRLTVAYRLPDVSTGEQARYDGHLSRVAAGGSLRITPELTVQADAARNGYGLGGLGIRTYTVAPSAGVDYVVRRTSPSLALSYRLDSEYVTRTKRAISASQTIPLSDRENHSVQLSSNISRGRAQFTAFGGWTKDRVGGVGGPTAGFGAVALLGDLWRLEGNGGLSSVARPGVSGRQLYLRMSLSRFLELR
jgi:hypothetical protein